VNFGFWILDCGWQSPRVETFHQSKIQNPKSWKFDFPLATSILLSLIPSLALWFFKRKS